MNQSSRRTHNSPNLALTERFYGNWSCDIGRYHIVLGNELQLRNGLVTWRPLLDWGPPHLNLVVYYIFRLMTPLLCKTWFKKVCNRNCKNPVLDTRTLGTSNRAIYCNLQNTCFSLLIDLDTLIIISPKIDAPYLWIRPLGLVPSNLAHRLL